MKRGEEEEEDDEEESDRRSHGERGESTPRAGRRGGFAPVSPGGFIEPHTAWYGVPATVLYAMYQNAADPRPSRRGALGAARSQAVTLCVMEASFFILNLPSPSLQVRETSFLAARPSLTREFNSSPLAIMENDRELCTSHEIMLICLSKSLRLTKISNLYYLLQM